MLRRKPQLLGIRHGLCAALALTCLNLSRAALWRRFVVRPALARFFVGAYMLLKGKVAEEEGNLAFGLAKPLSDNLVFYGYSSASLACASFILRATLMIDKRLLMSTSGGGDTARETASRARSELKQEATGCSRTWMA